jgi:Cof subfamily protein (haloacid dehalogenase superfamily)
VNSATDIRLVLSDVDGTLVTNDKILTPAALSAVQSLRRAGIAFAITSSRPPRGLRMLVEPLGLDQPLAAVNGGILVRSDLTVIERHEIDPAAARQAVDMMQAHGLDVWVYTAKRWFVRDAAAPHVAREQWILKFAPKVLTEFGVAQLNRAVKIVGVSDQPELIAAAERALERVIAAEATIVCSQTYFLDITSREASKGAAVAALATRLNITPAQIATIGDGSNDVSMFEASGFSIAMGNASDAVKARASVVTDTNENDGFAKAMSAFILRAAAA